MLANENDPTLYSLLQQHFELLDSLPTIHDSVFKNDQGIERYETLLTFAHKKTFAAEYHYHNVLNLLRSDFAQAQKQTDDFLQDIRNSPVSLTSASMRSSEVVDKYTYELAAFLEALKSSIDLLAETSAYYLSGVQVNYSISPLLRLVNKGRRSSILDVIATQKEWLEQLRNYRHHLVHRLVLTIRSGYEAQVFADGYTTLSHPVIIPKTTPSYVPDTRKSRMADDGPLNNECQPGIGYKETQVTLTYINENQQQCTHTSIKRTTASQDYIAIEEFMTMHLKEHKRFFANLLFTFENLEFRSTKPS